MIKSMTRSTVTNRVDYRSMLAGNDAYSPGAFELISTTVLSSANSSISFTGIPNTYKHLQIRMVAKTTDLNTQAWLRINGVSSATYSQHYLDGNGSSVSSNGTANTDRIWFANTNTTYFAPCIIDILDYASTTKNKSIRAFSGYINADGVRLTSGMLVSTSAITSLTILNSQSNNFSVGSRFSLYGVKGS